METFLIRVIFIGYISTSLCKSQPNIVLLLADDLGFGDLSIRGHPTSNTPNLDKLAATSLDLQDFYVASSVCSPSRAAILTGRYPVSTGIWPGVFFPDSLGGLNASSYTSLASELSRIGYKTSLIGKWHLGVGLNQEYLPTKHGFQQYLGIPYSHDMCPCLKCFDGHTSKRAEDDNCYDTCRLDEVGCPLFRQETILEQPTDLTLLTAKYNQAAISFIDSSLAEKKPFFLMMAYHQTHHPQFASKKWTASSQRGRFGDALSEMDDSIGRILDTIYRKDAANNTLVIFTSDNGPSLARHQRGGCAGLLRCGKGTTWEGGIRVPAFFHWKGLIRPRKSSELFSALDIFPTVMSVVGHPLPKVVEVHGVDQSKFIFQLHESKRQYIAHFAQSPTSRFDAIKAIRWKSYKAHYLTEGNSLSDDTNIDRNCSSKTFEGAVTHWDPPLLYDLSKDPGERYPLLNSTIFTFILEKMKSLRDDVFSTVTWAPSEMEKGTSSLAVPCCGSSDHLCQPFPQCCNCH